ncbi:hypothetical protein AMK32_25765 [Streptomyces sp. CB01883]|nr:hypothetical protein AMK32_25765 [Streptomyces sp. CB01883]
MQRLSMRSRAIDGEGCEGGASMGRESQGETVVGNEGDGLGRGERGGGDRLALPSPRHSRQRTVRWTPPKAV